MQAYYGQEWLQRTRRKRLAELKSIRGLATGFLFLSLAPSAVTADAPQNELRLRDVQARFEARLPDEAKEDAPALARALMHAAAHYRFSPALLLAVIDTESGFRYDAHSQVGAVGLMQVRPSTAAEIAHRYRIPYRGERDLKDPVRNLELGTAYLAHLRDRFRRPYRYLAAYNVGPKGLTRVGGESAGNRYARKVHGRNATREAAAY